MRAARGANRHRAGLYHRSAPPTRRWRPRRPLQGARSTCSSFEAVRLDPLVTPDAEMAPPTRGPKKYKRSAIRVAACPTCCLSSFVLCSCTHSAHIRHFIPLPPAMTVVTSCPSIPSHLYPRGPPPGYRPLNAPAGESHPTPVVTTQMDKAALRSRAMKFPSLLAQ